MPPRIRKLFKIEAEELKFGSENLPTLKQVLKHGLFLKETKYLTLPMQVRSAKWQLIAFDVAQKLHQIWIKEFGIPERCLRTILSLKQPLKDQFDRFNSTPKLDIQ